MSSHLFLLDTSVWIHLNRRNPPERILHRADSLISANLAAFNQVIRSEVLIGCRTEREYLANDAQIGGLRELTLHQPVWDAAANLGYALRRKGLTVALPDLLIAASALEHEAVVVHADSDFDKIAAQSDLRTESFAAPSV